MNRAEFSKKLRGLLAHVGLVRAKKPYDPFARLAEAFNQRIRTCHQFSIPPNPTNGDGKKEHFVFLVTPWLSTAAPLLALECALSVARTGAQVTLIMDGADLAVNAMDAPHARMLRGLIAATPLRKSVSDPETFPVDAREGDATLAARIFRENAIWRSRGEDKADTFLSERRPEVEALITAHLGRIRSLFQGLAGRGITRLLSPGGIFGLSALYVAVARELGIPFATFDGGKGLLRLAQNGVAAHLADVPDALRAILLTLSDDARARTISMAREELENRMHARDALQYQLSPASGSTDTVCDILIPLNIRWDSAALARQHCFASVGEWLEATLRWIADRPGVRVCIRQHPRERLAFAKSSDSLQPLLDRFQFMGDRLRFVPAEEPLSTYDLLGPCKVVLPHTSTVGIESAMLGKAVILSARAYYESLDFCTRAENADDYFAKLAEALEGGLVPSAEQRERAALAYFVTQRCALMRTCFNAHPDSFAEWCALSPAALQAFPEVEDFFRAFRSGVPLPKLRHERLCEAPIQAS